MPGYSTLVSSNFSVTFRQFLRWFLTSWKFSGPEFEVRIRGNEADNPKFNFLNPNDPYYAYYEHKLKEFRETDAPEPGICLIILVEQDILKCTNGCRYNSLVYTFIK